MSDWTDEVKRLIDMAGDWIETDQSLRSTACIEAALDHAKELDAEVVALRQRVEELEREKITFHGASVWADQDEVLRKRAEAAERRVEELERRDNYEGRITNLLRDVEILTKRAEAAEAEVERLREEAAILRVELGDEYNAALHRAKVSGRADEARAALRGGGE